MPSERRQEPRADLLAAIGPLLVMAAEDLQDPLWRIRESATLLRSELKGREPLLKQVEEILRGAGDADRLLEEILDFCRPLRPRAESVEMEELIGESLAVLRRSSRWTKRIDLDLRLDPSLPPCLGDRRLLLQALTSLYENAIDAMDGSGLLGVRARASGSVRRPDRLRIVVRDTGRGLSAEEVAHVFTPFYSTKPGGAGLGLSLVRRIAQAHQGHVHVISAPLRGTSVVLDLPAAGLEVGGGSTELGREALLERVREAA